MKGGLIIYGNMSFGIHVSKNTKGKSYEKKMFNAIDFRDRVNNGKASIFRYLDEHPLDAEHKRRNDIPRNHGIGQHMDKPHRTDGQRPDDFAKHIVHGGIHPGTISQRASGFALYDFYGSSFMPRNEHDVGINESQRYISA